MDENSENQKLVDIIIDLADSLGLKTIAEGVETEYQLKYLKNKECDFMQGYYEAKPMNSEELYNYLKTK